MKKRHFTKALALLFIVFQLSFKLAGQVPVEQLFLPYHDDPPGPFHIKTYINFIVDPSPATPWITLQEAETREQEVIAYLNSVYNQFNIFFHPGEGCANNNDKIFEFDFGSNPIDVRLLRAANQNAIHEGLDIYILDENTSDGGGVGYNVPNTFCHVKGKDEDDNPASLSVIIIHEVGHCLGLSHTFTSLASYPGANGGCNQTSTGCFGVNNEPCDCPPGVSPGYCCGDYVNDTPIFNNTGSSITTTGDCEPVNTNIDPSLAANIMSYVSPGTCRK